MSVILIHNYWLTLIILSGNWTSIMITCIFKLHTLFSFTMSTRVSCAPSLSGLKTEVEIHRWKMLKYEDFVANRYKVAILRVDCAALQSKLMFSNWWGRYLELFACVRRRKIANFNIIFFKRVNVKKINTKINFDFYLRPSPLRSSFCLY